MQILCMDPAALKMDHPFGMQHDQTYEHHHEVPSNTHSPNGTSHQAFSGSFDFELPTPTSYGQHYGSPTYQNFSAPSSLQPPNTTTLWPSQLLANPAQPSPSGPPNAVPLQPRPLAPLKQGASKDSAPPPSSSSPPTRANQPATTSRKTLTDADRREMCKYHEENPTTKQTEIGSMFGVERSTVSKVLRNKEKYLAPDDGRTSPTNNSKKQKSKVPDIERTLLNWAKNRQAEGQPVSEDEIKDEARKYATTMPDGESISQFEDPAWLETFKAKLLSSKPRNDRSKAKASQAPTTSSPNLAWDGSPPGSGGDGNKLRSPMSAFSEGSLWGHGHSQSTASYSSIMSDTGFSSEYRAPVSPGLFSPIAGSGNSPAMLNSKASRLPTLAPAKLQRRQTVPHVGGEDGANLGIHTHGLSTTSTSDGAMDISPMGINTSMGQPSRPTTVPANNFLPSPSNNTTTSPFSMYPPSNTSLSSSMTLSIGNNTSSTPNMDSPSAPPSQDEALAAFEILQKYLKHQTKGVMDPHDELVMAKWTQMLRIDAQNSQGGNYVMPMNERGDGTAPLGRKRSEHSLS